MIGAAAPAGNGTRHRPCRNLGGERQRRAWHAEVGRADGVAVHLRVVEGGNVRDGRDVAGEDAGYRTARRRRALSSGRAIPRGRAGER